MQNFNTFALIFRSLCLEIRLVVSVYRKQDSLRRAKEIAIVAFAEEGLGWDAGKDMKRRLQRSVLGRIEHLAIDDKIVVRNIATEDVLGMCIYAFPLPEKECIVPNWFRGTIFISAWALTLSVQQQ